MHFFLKMFSIELMLLVSDVLLEWRDILKQVNDSLVVVPELNSLLPLQSLYHV